ncbi:alpha-(1,3)-fucosyltransferase C-like [Penaeus monodon]|uniref:alpha-(1,3)-fucosyltransferase C-like n=1 Tax=Penaeus monodon TaxID=6687 RepID=UPI0018A78F7C|nr:alpha-(1,3)-fucosyltransferase C-like [Penaeus monodon]
MAGTSASSSVYRAIFRAGRRRGFLSCLVCLLLLPIWASLSFENVYYIRRHRELLQKATSEIPFSVTSKTVEVPYDVTSKNVEVLSDVTSKKLETPYDVTSKKLETPYDVTSKKLETPYDVMSKKLELYDVNVKKIDKPNYSAIKKLKAPRDVTDTPHTVAGVRLKIPCNVTREKLIATFNATSEKLDMPSDVTSQKLPSYDVLKNDDVVNSIAEENNNESEKSEKIILLWKKFRRNVSEWRHIFSRQERGECGGAPCRVVYDKAFLQKADAVVIRPTVHRLPRARTPSQLWILFSVEAPTHPEWNIARGKKGVFNWTMTYHGDSDVIMPFGRVLPRPPQHRQERKRDYWSEKNASQLAVWITSHCETPSRREEYVAALRRVVGVDVYGSCGNLPSGTRDTIAYMPKEVSSTHLGSSYMFYLAFENSICEDYVTEKFFKALAMDVVPVVLGGANYSSIAPPNSFVDAMDFASPVLLGAHLLSIARNRSLYNSFFAWKNEYQIDLGFPFYPLVCDLCRKLHQSSRQSVRTYTDVESWFRKVSRESVNLSTLESRASC